MLIDLHIHTRHTPGCTLSPTDVVRRAREAGLDGVVVTDMNTLEALAEVREAARTEGFVALCGVEIATDRGHYLAYFPEPERVPALPQLFGTPPWPVADVIAKVVDLGGAVVAAHPYDRTVERPGGDVIFSLDGLAAVEGLDARRRPSVNDLAVEAAEHMGLPCVGGSGARESLSEIGKAATLLRNPVRTEAELVAELRAGSVHCVALGVTPDEEGTARGRGPVDRRGARHGRGEARGPRRDR